MRERERERERERGRERPRQTGQMQGQAREIYKESAYTLVCDGKREW